MILQALYEYYQRKAADPESNIAPEGFEWKEIPFLIVLDNDGRFVRLEDTREGEGRIRKAKSFLLPKSEGRSGKNGWMIANLLWDHYGYVLAHPKGEKKENVEMAKKQHGVFTQKLFDLPEAIRKSDAVALLIKFYEEGQTQKVFADPLWDECQKITGCNLTFRIEGSQILIAESNIVKEYVASCQAAQVSTTEEDDEESYKTTNSIIEAACLITGEKTLIARKHSRTSINKDTKSLVAIQKNSGYDSYGKQQAYNCPIGTSAEFAYTTALNALLKKGPDNRLQIGDTATVFWAEKKTKLEQTFPLFFSLPPKDDPDADIRAVRSLYEGLYTGSPPEETKTRFYVLGLAPNAARISVRFWHQGSVSEISDVIKRHFEDSKIVMGPKDNGRIALMNMLCSISTENKADNIPPNLAGEMMRSILTGLSYPATLLQQCIRRIRAEQTVSRIRAAILKAYLNRFYRTHITIEKEITVALDQENLNAGYRLGRLFAVLEKIQEDANPGINATIRERFYGAASSSPVTVFPQLLKLKNHHLAKLENPSFKVNHEKKLTEIIGGLPADMPAHLAMEDQARFAIGYYHQRQALFTSKKDKAESSTEKETEK